MAIFIKPVNKTLLVEREQVEDKKNDLGIIIPETVRTVGISSTATVKLLACEDKSIYENYVGKKLLVRVAMIEDVEFKTTKASFVSENGVVAIISESGIL